MLPDVPAGLIYSSIRKGTIKVNGKKSRQSYRIQENDVIAVKETIQHSVSVEKPFSESSRNTADLDSMTILRTDNLVFINKPSGMLTHGSNSLADLLLTGLDGIEDSLSFKPAPLHRLDRNTSGLITASASIMGASRFSELMKNRQIRKYYLGVCLDGPAAPVRLVDDLKRSSNITSKAEPGETGQAVKTGITEAEPLCSNENLTLCLFRIETGLTHQIRSQAAEAGFPLAGDSKYGGKTGSIKRYILHSWAMVLPDYDEICGIRTVFADPSPGLLKILSGLFGKTRVDSALQNAKSEIISI